MSLPPLAFPPQENQNLPRRAHSVPYVTLTTRIPKDLSDAVAQLVWDPYTSAPRVGARQQIIIRALEEFVVKHRGQDILALIQGDPA